MILTPSLNLSNINKKKDFKERVFFMDVNNKTKKNIARILIFIILFQYISMISPIFSSINFAIYTGEEWKTGTADDGSVWQYKIEDGNATNLSCVSYPYNPVEDFGDYYHVVITGHNVSHITNIPSSITDEIPIQSISVPSSIDGYTVVSFAGMQNNSNDLKEFMINIQVHMYSIKI